MTCAGVVYNYGTIRCGIFYMHTNRHCYSYIDIYRTELTRSYWLEDSWVSGRISNSWIFVTKRSGNTGTIWRAWTCGISAIEIRRKLLGHYIDSHTILLSRFLYALVSHQNAAHDRQIWAETTTSATQVHQLHILNASTHHTYIMRCTVCDHSTTASIVATTMSTANSREFSDILTFT